VSDKWAFLNTFNATGFKGWSVGWLWLYTGAIWGIVAVVAGSSAKATPTEWLATWLAGLTAYSGVSYLQNKNARETDYGYVERKAGAAPGTLTGTTQEQPTK
jgi:hypothetical protein